MERILLLLFFVFTGTINSQSAKIVKGKVSSKGSPVAFVQVTDGKSIVLTDKKGNFSMEVAPGSAFVYYSLPAGYNSPIENGIPVFYQKIDSSNQNQKVNFELIQSKQEQTKHAFIVWADPQVQTIGEFDQLELVVNDVNKTLTALAPEIPVHALCAGDIVFDRLHFFDKYKQLISTLNVPFYQSIGNHDLDYNNRSDGFSDSSYQNAFGPSHYSFNVGKIHYVVLKNVFYYGMSRRYIGYVDENQLQWLTQDLRGVNPGSTVVLTLHIPTVYGESEKSGSFSDEMSNSLLNREALYQLLKPFNTHILAGHSHTQWHTQVMPGISEHVHAAASGAWWKADICTDGSPKSYMVYQVDGNQLSWYLKGVQKDKNDQFKLYRRGADRQNPDCIVANVYNYDINWKVMWYENNEFKGEMERYWGTDPDAALIFHPDKNKKHAWIKAAQTHHLFKAVPQDTNALIRVEVIDCFGNKFVKMLE